MSTAALVTGAASGIGRSLARLLHQRGHALVAVDLDGEGLAGLVAELAGPAAPAVVALPCDLGGAAAAAELLRATRARELEVGVLVNCAGFGLFGEQLELEPERLGAMLRVNVVALTELSTVYGREMRARGRGYILNVASTASFQPLPRLAAYAASKHYVSAFTLALADELAPHGVSVSLLCPGTTRTPFLETAGVSGDRRVARLARAVAMEPDRVAERAVAGLFAGERRIVPGLANRGHAVLARVAPGAAARLFGLVGGGLSDGGGRRR